MTVRRENRVRKDGGEQVLRELKVEEACEQPSSSEPARGEIERRAYQIYLARNGAPGSAELDWLQAECELRAQEAASAQRD